MKKIIAILLLISIVVVSLSSCNKDEPFSGEADLLPKGYTGGIWGSREGGSQIYWVESYNKAIENVRILTKHNSTFVDTATITYEGDLFDVKYGFDMKKDKTEFPIKLGEESPYERQVYDVEIITYLFFEDVTIEEFVYHDRIFYEIFEFGATTKFQIKLADGEIPIENLTCEWDEQKKTYFIYIGEIEAFYLRACGGTSMDVKVVSDEVIQEIISSIVYVGLDD